MVDLAIPEPQILASLRADNPWWSASAAAERPARNWPKRAYFEPFRRLLRRDVVRAVVLLGARRVGKTTMLLQLAGEAAKGGEFGPVLFAAIDTPTYGGLTIERFLDLFEKAHPHRADARRLVLLDEIQYLADWERQLKVLVDRFPRTRFVASGSAGAALRRKSNESGAGRFTDFELPPLTFAEFLRFRGLDGKLIDERAGKELRIEPRDLARLNREFVTYLNVGGFPEIAFSPAAQDEISRSVGRDIVEKVLLRDLPTLYGIDDVTELNRLFSTLAWHTGREINFEALAQSSGVARNTVTKYLDYLEAAFLIFRVRRIDDGARHFARQRTFKVYLANTSIRTALFGPCAEGDDAIGHVAETAAFAQWLHAPEFRHLHYARGARGEVDIVGLDPGTQRPAFAYDVKWSDRVVDHPEEIAPLIAFAKKTGLAEVGVSTRTKRFERTIDGVEVRFFPLALQCYRLGRMLIDETARIRRLDTLLGASP